MNIDTHDLFARHFQPLGHAGLVNSTPNEADSVRVEMSRDLDSDVDKMKSEGFVLVGKAEFVGRGNGTVPETAEKFKTVMWDAARLREGDGYFVRSEVWRNASPGAGWSQEVTEPGPPKAGTVEQVFMIEPYEGETAYIRAGCSLQGDVSREMMRELRPDFPIGSGS